MGHIPKNRHEPELSELKRMVENLDYSFINKQKYILLCQIKNQLKEPSARFTVGSLGIYLQRIAGILARRKSLKIARLIKPNKNMKLLQLLDGKKSYVAAVLMAVFGVVKAFGVELTPEQDLAILTLIGALLSVGMAHKLEKIK